MYCIIPPHPVKQTSVTLIKIKILCFNPWPDYNQAMAPVQRAQKRKNTSTVTAPANTRERILAYLQENRIASVQALSRTWGLTRADIRYHFNALIKEGLLERAPRDASLPARRGRPEQQYRLAASAAPDNFPALCAALLDALLSALPVEEQEKALRALAARLAGSIATPKPGIALHLTQRLNQVSAFLSRQGYRARWEAHASGPQILLRSCPYAALLPTHPELCTLDRFLLEDLLQLPLQQTARQSLSGGKPAACVFVGVEKS